MTKTITILLDAPALASAADELGPVDLVVAAYVDAALRRIRDRDGTVGWVQQYLWTTNTDPFLSVSQQAISRQPVDEVAPRGAGDGAHAALVIGVAGEAHAVPHRARQLAPLEGERGRVGARRRRPSTRSARSGAARRTTSTT